jgi:hypothetical protein
MLNLLARTIFTRDLTDLDDHGQSREFHQVVLEIMEAAGSPNLSDFFPAFASADLQGRRRVVDELFARLNRVFDTEVEQRLRGQTQRNDFLDDLRWTTTAWWGWTATP